MEVEVEELVAEQRAVLALPLTAGERRAELTATACFLALAVPLALSNWSPTPWDWPRAVILVLAYAAARRVRFETGFGFTDGSLLVLVPMLFVLPAHLAPLLCAAGLLLGRLPDYLSGRVHPSVALAVPGNTLHVVGPAAVIAAGVDGGPHWGDWPWFLLAAAAYVVADATYAVARESIAHRVAPSLQLRVLGEIYLLDGLLAPVGLMAAFATQHAEYAFLLAAPLLLLLRGEARERAARLDKALELSESRRELLEAELAAARSREEVLATVSHGLQMPLATIVGLSSLLAERGDGLPPERRAESVGALRDEAVALRQLVRQALDYVALRSGQALRVAGQDVDLGPLAADLGVPSDGAALIAHADPGRVRQVLLALQAQAREHGADGPRLEAGVPGVRAVLSLPGPAPEDLEAPFADVVDLVVARALCRAMGGDLRGEATPTGWRVIAELPTGHVVSPAR